MADLLSPPPQPAATGGRPPLSSSTRPSAPTAGGRRWEALLIPPGITANRGWYTGRVLRDATPLFVGAAFRVARSLIHGHGVQPPPGGSSMLRSLREVEHAERFDGEVRSLIAAVGSEPVQDALRREAAFTDVDAIDPALVEPHRVGTVVDARFDPYAGVVGVIEVDGVAGDGPFDWLGLLPQDQPVSGGLHSAWRSGQGGLLTVSIVPVGQAHEGSGPDGRPALLVDALASITAIDLVFFPATSAQLIRPI